VKGRRGSSLRAKGGQAFPSPFVIPLRKNFLPEIQLGRRSFQDIEKLRPTPLGFPRGWLIALRFDDENAYPFRERRPPPPVDRRRLQRSFDEDFALCALIFNRSFFPVSPFRNIDANMHIQGNIACGYRYHSHDICTSHLSNCFPRSVLLVFYNPKNYVTPAMHSCASYFSSSTTVLPRP